MPVEWSNPVFDYKTFTYSFDLRNKNNYNLLPLEAAIKTVNYIKDNYPEPHVLYLSGGVDSQAMLYAWHLSNVPFTTYSAIYNDDVNLHDLECLKAFANTLNVPINFVNFDLYSFLENEHDFYARTYYTGSPHYTTFMKMVNNQVQGTAIMSGNLFRPGHYYYDSQNNKPLKINRYTPGFDANNICLFHYINKTGKKLVPFFFIETEYLTHSFTVKPNKNIEDSHNFILQEVLTNDPIRVNHAKYLNKIAYYQNNGFPVIPQNNPQQGKYTGFEKVKDYYDKVYEQQLQLLTGGELEKFKNKYRTLKVARISGQLSNRYFDIRFRNIYETYISKHKLIIRTV